MTNPASLLLSLAEHDTHMCFAYHLNNNLFIYTNPAFKSFFRITETETAANKLLAMVYADDKTYLKQVYATLQPNVFKNNIEFRMRLTDGKECFLRLNLLLQNTEAKENIITGYVEDLTDDKLCCENLDELINKKKDILNIISHDVAGPIGSIQNLASLISRKIKLFDDQEVKRWVLLIEEISKKSVHTIQSFVKKEFLESANINSTSKNKIISNY